MSSYHQPSYGRGGPPYDLPSDGSSRADADPRGPQPATPVQKGDLQALTALLHSIDGAPYPRYKGLYGEWQLSDALSLTFDHVQSDAYAAPSRARLRVPLPVAAFPASLHSSRVRRVAFCHFLARTFAREASAIRLDVVARAAGWSSSKGGAVIIDAPSQHVLERTACMLRDDCIELRVAIALPAHGRTIEGAFAAAVLGESLPAVAQSALLSQNHDLEKLTAFVDCIDDQAELRARLGDIGLVAFVVDGARLPRASGANDAPLAGDAVVPFKAPAALALDVELSSGRKLRGMGVRPGVTLIVGGGFHGKSTLLAALAVGMYDKVPGDGREFVCVRPDTVSVRAEDGRSVAGVDISPFITNLPFDKRTDHFCTPDASGSTSQATNIVEALDAGAKLLLTDEDLAATNFMMRDTRMQRLVPPDKEPITPMVHRIRAMFENEGVSSILVIGGTGDYFEVSDKVIMMDSYTPHDVTEKAHKIAGDSPSEVVSNEVPVDLFKPSKKRRIMASSLRGIAARGKMQAREMDTVRLGSETIDLSAVAQIVEISQTRAIAAALKTISEMPELDEEDAVSCVAKLEEGINARGLDAVNPFGDLMGNYSRPRTIEILAALNRLRGIEVLK